MMRSFRDLDAPFAEPADEIPVEDWVVPPGWRLVYRETTGSTNDDAKAAARRGGANRTIFLANRQTAGRGRYGRSWIAPSDTCLLLSVLLEGALTPIECTAAASVAVADAIAAIGLQARIKWPNDIMIDARKVCGILTEVVASGDRLATVVGVGVNVNVDLDTDGLPSTATSLAAEIGRPVARAAMFRELLSRLDELLAIDPVRLAPRLHRRWGSLLWRRSQYVRLADGAGVLEGVVEGLAPSGGLLLRLQDGALREVTNGELLL